MLKKAPKSTYEFFIDHFADEVLKISGSTYLKATLFKNYETKQPTQLVVYRLAKDKEELSLGHLIIK